MFNVLCVFLHFIIVVQFFRKLFDLVSYSSWYLLHNCPRYFFFKELFISLRMSEFTIRHGESIPWSINFSTSNHSKMKPFQSLDLHFLFFTHDNENNSVASKYFFNFRLLKTYVLYCLTSIFYKSSNPELQ